jgi:bifunctional non-homologous end joining protein LigD
MSKKPVPEFVAPMMASSAKKPFNDPDWIFETKLGGYRGIAVIAPWEGSALVSKSLTLGTQVPDHSRRGQ